MHHTPIAYTHPSHPSHHAHTTHTPHIPIIPLTVVLEELWLRAHELPPVARDLISRLVHMQTTLMRFRQDVDHTEPELQAVEVRV